MTLDTAELRVTGNIKANGTITDLAESGGKSMDGMRATYNTHTHQGDSGGTTSPPSQTM